MMRSENMQQQQHSRTPYWQRFGFIGVGLLVVFVIAASCTFDIQINSANAAKGGDHGMVETKSASTLRIKTKPSNSNGTESDSQDENGKLNKEYASSKNSDNDESSEILETSVEQTASKEKAVESSKEVEEKSSEDEEEEFSEEDDEKEASEDDEELFEERDEASEEDEESSEEEEWSSEEEEASSEEESDSSEEGEWSSEEGEASSEEESDLSEEGEWSSEEVSDSSEEEEWPSEEEESDSSEEEEWPSEEKEASSKEKEWPSEEEADSLEEDEASSKEGDEDEWASEVEDDEDSLEESYDISTLDCNHANPNVIFGKTIRKARNKAKKASTMPMPPLSTPILLVGLQKAGTATMYYYFQRGGYNVSHWMCNREEGIPCGHCIHRAIQDENDKPLKSCGNYDVWTQLGVDTPHGHYCHFPQITDLEELHAEAPDATFIVNIANVSHWAHSMTTDWNLHANSNQTISIPRKKEKTPAAIRTSASSNSEDDAKEYVEVVPPSPGERLAMCDKSFGPQSADPNDLMAWHCRHIQRIRQFVKGHPTHSLIELQVGDEGNGKRMESYFGIDAKYWGHLHYGNLASSPAQQPNNPNDRTLFQRGNQLRRRERASARARYRLLHERKRNLH